MNIFLTTYIRVRPRGMKTALLNHDDHQENVQRCFRYHRNTLYYVLSNDHRCNSSFIHNLLRQMISSSRLNKLSPHNGSAAFGKMPKDVSWLPRCKQTSRQRSTSMLRQHRPFMSIKSFVQHSGWWGAVSLCLLIRLICVCADHDQPEFLCSHSDSRYSGVYVATAGGC